MLLQWEYSNIHDLKQVSHKGHVRWTNWVLSDVFLLTLKKLSSFFSILQCFFTVRVLREDEEVFKSLFNSLRNFSSIFLTQLFMFMIWIKNSSFIIFAVKSVQFQTSFFYKRSKIIIKELKNCETSLLFLKISVSQSFNSNVFGQLITSRVEHGKEL